MPVDFAMSDCVRSSDSRRPSMRLATFFIVFIKQCICQQGGNREAIAIMLFPNANIRYKDRDSKQRCSFCEIMA